MSNETTRKRKRNEKDDAEDIENTAPEPKKLRKSNRIRQKKAQKKKIGPKTKPKPKKTLNNKRNKTKKKRKKRKKHRNFSSKPITAHQISVGKGDETPPFQWDTTPTSP